jgi:hypothetical protein
VRIRKNKATQTINISPYAAINFRARLIAIGLSASEIDGINPHFSDTA